MPIKRSRFQSNLSQAPNMGSWVLEKGRRILVFWAIFSFIGGAGANETVEGSVFVDAGTAVATTDEDFVCATLDWWPPEKCDYGTCSWGHASLLNLDLKNTVFLNAVKAFSPLKIRLGGSLQDKVIYQTEGDQNPCIPFAKNASQLFGFTQGCLPLARWDELYSFFSQSGAVIIFGLNALHGKTIQPNNTATGPWDPSNAASFIRYSVKKGYNIYGWELGNELSGAGVGVGIGVAPYANDTIVLHNLIEEIYADSDIKPLTVAPGGFLDADWFKKFIVKTSGSLDVITHHIYNLGAGSDEHLIDRILNPSILDAGGEDFKKLRNLVDGLGTSAVAWVGEAGGAYNSGRDKVTNAFVFSFWYLNQLGMASARDTKTYCRQSLVGGNYGLLDTATFNPNPDYYSALLWHRLMGRRVLSTNFSGTNMIRAYGHCSKKSQGITLLLLNFDGKTTVQAKVEVDGTSVRVRRHGHRHHKHRSKVAPTLAHAEQVTLREEYHLTPMDGYIQSRTVLLNGKALMVDSSGSIPDMEPELFNASEPISVAPYSTVFAHLPYVAASTCK